VSVAERRPGRVDAAPAWILHQYPYKETSQIVEAWTPQHGRVALVARGARRPGSSLRGVLLAFQPLRLSWFGLGELKTLHAADWVGGVPQLNGLSLMCGFYLNELLLKLMPREDAHPVLFAAYDTAIRALATHAEAPEPLLRRFELALLQEVGFGLTLTADAQGKPVLPEGRYRYQPGQGLMRGDGPAAVEGRTLLAMAQADYRDAATLAQAKSLIRAVLAHLLGGTPLHTRQLLRELHIPET
jgi:DNA repair protein RecO (recombination protein O)